MINHQLIGTDGTGNNTNEEANLDPTNGTGSQSNEGAGDESSVGTIDGEDSDESGIENGEGSVGSIGEEEVIVNTDEYPGDSSTAGT